MHNEEDTRCYASIQVELVSDPVVRIASRSHMRRLVEVSYKLGAAALIIIIGMCVIQESRCSSVQINCATMRLFSLYPLVFSLTVLVRIPPRAVPPTRDI
jgi:hypothetical protein